MDKADMMVMVVVVVIDIFFFWGFGEIFNDYNLPSGFWTVWAHERTFSTQQIGILLM